MEQSTVWAIMVSCLLALAAGAILWTRYRKDAALEAAICAILPILVTEAEKLFGDGAGPIKLSWVINKIYEKLPAALTAQISQDKLAALVDKALDKLRPLWADKPGLLLDIGTSGYITTNAVEFEVLGDFSETATIAEIDR